MTEPRTAAGRALLDDVLNNRDSEWSVAGTWTDRVLAIEAEASASFWPTPEQADDLIETWLRSPEAERRLWPEHMTLPKAKRILAALRGESA